MRNIFYSSALVALIIFTGCKSNSHVIKCPDVFVAKGHHAIWAKSPHSGKNNTPGNHAQVSNPPAPREKEEALASASTEVPPFQVKIPRFATGKLSEEELAGMNSLFVKYSNNTVQLERNEKGKLYLKAHEQKDVFKLAKTFMALKKTNPAALADNDAGGRIAIAGGIIGIVAIVFALGPFVSYGAFVLGLIALILGAVGLRSSRRGWAITGIVLGVLAILFAGVLGIGIYTIVLHI